MHRLRDRIYRLLMGVEDDDALIAASPTVPIGEIFRRFWPLRRPYRPWMAVALVFVVISPAIDTATI